MTWRHAGVAAVLVVGLLATLVWWLASTPSYPSCRRACYSRGFPQADLSDGRCFCLNAYSAVEIPLGDSE